MTFKFVIFDQTANKCLVQFAKSNFPKVLTCIKKRDPKLGSNMRTCLATEITHGEVMSTIWCFGLYFISRLLDFAVMPSFTKICSVGDAMPIELFCLTASKYPAADSNTVSKQVFWWHSFYVLNASFLFLEMNNAKHKCLH